MKKKYWGLGVIIGIALIGIMIIYGTKHSYKQVVFLNNYIEFGYDAEVQRWHIFQSDYYEAADEEQLYAFYKQPQLVSQVSNKSDYDSDMLVAGDCVVAGTLEQLQEVFGGSDPLNGWFCTLEPAPRPDFAEVKQLLGEEKQVIIKVKVEK